MNSGINNVSCLLWPQLQGSECEERVELDFAVWQLSHHGPFVPEEKPGATEAFVKTSDDSGQQGTYSSGTINLILFYS